VSQYEQLMAAGGQQMLLTAAGGFHMLMFDQIIMNCK